MAYPAYDNGGIAVPSYSNQVGFPISRRPSMYSHPSEYGGYDPAVTGGAYSDVSTFTLVSRSRYSPHPRSLATLALGRPFSPHTRPLAR